MWRRTPSREAVANTFYLTFLFIMISMIRIRPLRVLMVLVLCIVNDLILSMLPFMERYSTMTKNFYKGSLSTAG